MTTLEQSANSMARAFSRLRSIADMIDYINKPHADVAELLEVAARSIRQALSGERPEILTGEFLDKRGL